MLLGRGKDKKEKKEKKEKKPPKQKQPKLPKLLKQSKQQKQEEQIESSVVVAREERFSAVGRVSINDFFGYALLNDISLGGFSLASKTYVALNIGEEYTMRIYPDHESDIEPFDLTVEVRWVRCTEKRFVVGFMIVSKPDDNAFDHYVEYIRTKVIENYEKSQENHEVEEKKAEEEGEGEKKEEKPVES